jgi:uncharacterized protein
LTGGLDGGDIALLAAALVVAGAVTGVLAGLFGVGGGAIIVPVLFEAFRLVGVAEEVRMPLAVGTSLAIIIPTSLRSAHGHWRKGALDLALLRRWAVPIVAGTLGGAVLARYAAPWVFQLVFIGVAAVIAAKMLFSRASWRFTNHLPGPPLLQVYGVVIGVLSALMGVGGGAISNIMQTLHGRDIRQSVATSAGVGVLIAIPGTLGYIWAGWGKPGLPPAALGFVSLLGFALFVPTTTLTAQVGVNLAHSLDRRTLEVLFALFLLTVAARFLYAMLS